MKLYKSRIFCGLNFPTNILIQKSFFQAYQGSCYSDSLLSSVFSRIKLLLVLLAFGKISLWFSPWIKY